MMCGKLQNLDGSPLDWPTLLARLDAHYLTHDDAGWPLPPLTTAQQGVLSQFEDGAKRRPTQSWAEIECSRLTASGYLEYVGSTYYRLQERPWYRATARGLAAMRLAGIQEEAS